MSPVDTLYKWQNQRFLWVLMALAMGGLVLVSHFFFQNYLYMAPCEHCVYIRFAMLVMAAGGLVAAMNPKGVALKWMGCLAAFYGAISGMMHSITLNTIHHGVRDPEKVFTVPGCSIEPRFPFGLPLEQWFPGWFNPTGDCGFDAPIVPADVALSSVQQWFIDMYTQSEGWYLIPSLQFMNMAQACFLAFCLAFIMLVVMTIACSLKASNTRRSSRAT